MTPSDQPCNVKVSHPSSVFWYMLHSASMTPIGSRVKSLIRVLLDEWTLSSPTLYLS